MFTWETTGIHLLQLTVNLSAVGTDRNEKQMSPSLCCIYCIYWKSIKQLMEDMFIGKSFCRHPAVVGLAIPQWSEQGQQIQEEHGSGQFDHASKTNRNRTLATSVNGTGEKYIFDITWLCVICLIYALCHIKSKIFDSCYKETCLKFVSFWNTYIWSWKNTVWTVSVWNPHFKTASS